MLVIIYIDSQIFGYKLYFFKVRIDAYFFVKPKNGYLILVEKALSVNKFKRIFERFSYLRYFR